MMNIETEIQNSIVAILHNKTKAIMGTGFVVSENLILTCAHVVEMADSNVNWYPIDEHPKLVTITIEFAIGGLQLIGDVIPEYYSPSYELDVALIRVQSIPNSINRLLLGSASFSARNNFSSHGYAKLNNLKRISASGEIIDLLKNIIGKGIDLLELHSPQPDHGMSGGPVLDINRQLVVGLITQGKNKPSKDGSLQNIGTILATPMNAVFEICPELRESRPTYKFDEISNIDLGNVRLTIPGLEKSLIRQEIEQIEDQLKLGTSIIITGESGIGKSGIGHALAENGKKQNKVVLFSDARRFASCKLESDLCKELHIKNTFIDEFSKIGVEGGCRIIIDQFDSVIGLEISRIIAEIAEQIVKYANVEIILISRKEEGHEEKSLNSLMGKGFIEKEILPISLDQIITVLENIGLHPNEQLISLGTNLLNLELIGEIKRDNQDFNFSSILEEIDLWLKYVSTIENRETIGINFSESEALIEKATTLARIGLQNSDKDFRLVDLSEEQKRIVQRLVSRGIIFQVENKGYQYRFRNEKLQDFLYAKDAVFRGWMPSDVLNEINSYRTKNIFDWMQQIYDKENSPLRLQFFKEVMYG